MVNSSLDSRTASDQPSVVSPITPHCIELGQPGLVDLLSISASGFRQLEESGTRSHVSGFVNNYDSQQSPPTFILFSGDLVEHLMKGKVMRLEADCLQSTH